MLKASRVQISPDSHFYSIGNFKECQDNVHAAIGKAIISQHKFLPDLPNIHNYTEFPSLKNLIVLWLKGLPLKVDLAEGHDHHPAFIDFLIKNEALVLGGEAQENSELLLTTIITLFKGRKKLFKKQGLIVFQSYIKKLVENLDSYSNIKTLYENLEKKLKQEIKNFSNEKLDLSDEGDDESESDQEEEDKE